MTLDSTTNKRSIVTIADVAVKAGVSKAAAWAALSKRKTSITLAEDTRQRIAKIAREMNYRPNLNARGLAKQKSYMISFLCREEFSNEAMELLLGMQDAFFPKGYAVIVYAHGDTPFDELVNLRHAISRRSEAMIVAPALERDGSNNYERFSNLYADGTPVVQLFSKAIAGLPSVVPNSYEAAKTSVDYLIERGHRRIAHLTCEDFRDEITPGFYSAIKERWSGYKDAILNANLEPIVFTISDKIDWKDGSYEIAKSILSNSHCPTAVTTYNDTMAMGLIKGVLEEGVRVPEDISVVGHDGTELTTPGLDSRLATFLKPTRQMGREAAKMCLEMIAGRSVKDATCQCMFSPGMSVATLGKNGVVRNHFLGAYGVG